jgi:hypothetical protein
MLATCLFDSPIVFDVLHVAVASFVATAANLGLHPEIGRFSLAVIITMLGLIPAVLLLVAGIRAVRSGWREWIHWRQSVPIKRSILAPVADAGRLQLDSKRLQNLMVFASEKMDFSIQTEEGWLGQPRILIHPALTLELSQGELESLLSHELAHAVHDIRSVRLLRLLSVVTLSPMFHVSVLYDGVEREKRADQFALSSTQDIEALKRALKILELSQSQNIRLKDEQNSNRYSVRMILRSMGARLLEGQAGTVLKSLFYDEMFPGRYPSLEYRQYWWLKKGRSDGGA